MTDLPPIKGTATLDTAQWSKGIDTLQADLRNLQALSKRAGTIKLTADLSGMKDAQRITRDLMQAFQPTGLQQQIAGMFGGFDAGAKSARESASAFEAQAAALRARLGELDRAVRITRAEFQSGLGEASPQEIAELSTQMRRLQVELEQVGQEAKENFGEWSAEAFKAQNATRLAVATVAAANGQISRLGLASQVKLGASAALQQYGAQAGFAANNLFQMGLQSDQARIATGLFNKTIQKTGQDTGAASAGLAKLQDTLGVTADAARDGLRGLLRQGYNIEQATQALIGAGASALAAGRSAQDGMQAYVDAVTSMSSARLNEIGISENLSTFYQKEAKARNTTVDGLTKQQKVAAELNLIMAATGDEVGDLTALLSGAGGGLNSVNREMGEASKALGQEFIPLILNGTRALTGFLSFFNELPPAVKGTAAAFVGAGVVLAALSTPISSLINLYRMLTGAQVGAAVAENAVTASTVRMNAATAVKKFLLMDVGALYALGNKQAMLYSGGLNVATVSTNGLTAATTRLTAAWGALMATNIFTVAAVGLGALGLYWNQQVTEITATYEAMDQANQESFERMMRRVRELQKTGTDLSRAQARVLLIQEQLSQAQQGDLKGTNLLTGERIYGKPDEARIAKLQADLKAAREAVVGYYTEQQRRGPPAVKLTDDQTKAVRALNEALAGRQFDLKLTGKTDMQRDLAELGRDFEELRVKFKAAFTVKGVLQDTPDLRAGLAELDAQLAAEQAATRKRYADSAADAARESALSVQAAELEAMRDGRAKVEAQRAAELAAVKRDAAEKAKAYADFPKVRAQIESDAQAVMAAKRRAWALEDEQVARDHQARVVEAERSAEAAQVAAMEEGRAKREAQRALDVENLRRTIAEKVQALAGDPEAQAAVRASGAREVAALQESQGRERVREEREALRLVADARRAARDAETAAMQDDTARLRAERERQVEDFRRGIDERLEALRDYPAMQAQVLAEGNRQARALEAQWAREDERTARERAERIAAAWLAAQDAQQTAEAASRNAQLAAFELTLARRLAAVRENAVAVAQIEAQAITDRARITEQAQQAAFTADQQRLARERDRDLSAENLTAEERRAIWAQYYADLNALSATFQAGQRERQRQQVQDTAAAADALKKAQEEQLEKERELRASTLDRLEAEATYAERMARNQQDLTAARQQLLAVEQLRLRAVEDRIAQESDETELNRLHGERLALLTRIAEQTDRIRAAPIAEERRRLALYKAQAQTELTLRGLGGDRVATAELTAQIAARELQLANQRVATAQGELELEAAQQEQADARLAFAQALADQQQAGPEQDRTARQERLDALARELSLQQDLLDVQEARTRAAAQVTGWADDAVAAAQMELQFTRDRLALIASQLEGDLAPAQQADLLKERIGLLGQEAEQQRRVTDAQREQAELAQAIADAQVRLRAELAGGAPDATVTALTRIRDARQALTRAEAEYADAQRAVQALNTQGNQERLRTATDNLTTAIRGQRDAVAGLADVYRKQITEMDGVRSASERLNAAAYGQDGLPFDSRRERERLNAIQTRRNAAQKELAAALQTGRADLISKAAQELAAQEDRYRKQAELLEKNGVKFNREGEARTRALADQVDLLGINYDREAVLLEQRADLADVEAKAARELRDVVGEFTDTAADTLTALDTTLQAFTVALRTAKLQADTDARAQSVTTPVQLDGKTLEQIADSFARKLTPPLTQAAQALQPPALPTTGAVPYTAPGIKTQAAQTTITYTFGDIHVTPTGAVFNPREAARDLKRELMDELRRAGRTC